MLVEAVNHYSPSFTEAPAINVFTEALNHANITYSLQPVPLTSDDDSRANLLIHLGPDPPALLLVGHVDTIELWHNGDYGTRIEGDSLYGLGACDMKGGCVAIIEALTAIKESNILLNKGLYVALVVGEEEYGDGAKALLEKVWAPITVIGEPTSLMPCMSHYGYLEVCLMSNGISAHAALPNVGNNAIHAMLSWVMNIIEESQKLTFAKQFAINPREIHGGGPYFVVAENCDTIIDFHVPPDVGSDQIKIVIQKARKVTLQSHQNVELIYKQLLWAPGFSHDDEDERLNSLRKAYQTIGLKWQPAVFKSHSDANLFYLRGTLPVICGPGDLALAHRRGEWVSIAEVERAAYLYAAMIYECCGK